MPRPSLDAQIRYMNSELHQYPAALYSSVSEIGYRSERFTGEVLRSGSSFPRGAHRRHRLSQLRLWLTGEGRHSAAPLDSAPIDSAPLDSAPIDLRDAATPSRRLTVVGHAPHAHAR